MKVHLRQIPEGGSLHWEGEEEPGFIGLPEAGAEAVSPLRFALDVGLSEGGIFATGRLEIALKLRCVACLEDFETTFVLPEFALQKELDGREAVDISEEVREDIQLALPAYPRCDAEGRKTCPARFPQAPADASPSPGSAAWEALDRLKKENRPT
jgi:uncharacterized metal-binding protein YceD (DUF177 family)